MDCRKEKLTRRLEAAGENADTLEFIGIDWALTQIRDLLATREQFYKQADVLVNTDIRSVREVALHVVHQFRLESSSR